MHALLSERCNKMKETNIRKYAELMKELGLTGLEITEENSKVRLERSIAAPAEETLYSVPGAAANMQTAAGSKDYISVKSPIVGIFYTAPAAITGKVVASQICGISTIVVSSPT